MKTLLRLAAVLGLFALLGCEATVMSGELVEDGEGGEDGEDGEDSSNLPGSSGSGVGCSLGGLWDGVSPTYSNIPETRAAYRFDADGTWLGGPEGSDAETGSFMMGTYAISGDELSLEGAGMTTPGYGYVCAAEAEATFGLTFSADCNVVTIVTRTDDCTGARHYLSATYDGSTLVRR